MKLKTNSILGVCIAVSSIVPLQRARADDTSNAALAKRIQDLEKRLDTLESIPQIALVLKLRQLGSTPASPPPSPTPREDQPVELMGWAYSFHDGEYLWDKAHVISYTLYNRTAKAIKLVEGGIIFRDLLGHEILKIKLSQDEHCPPHQSTKVDGTWNVSSIGEEYRLKDMAHDDIKPELQIRRVVFDDNTIWNAEVK